MRGVGLDCCCMVHRVDSCHAGTHDTLVIRLAGQDKAVMLPFADALVPVVDVEAGRVTIRPPDGLLDLAISLDRVPGLPPGTV